MELFSNEFTRPTLYRHQTHRTAQTGGMGVARAPIRAPRFAKVTPNVARNVESPVNRASSGRREEKTTGLQPVRYPNRSRPTAIAPLDQALGARLTVPICAQSGPAFPLHATSIHPAPGTSFRCSHALSVSSCTEPLPLVSLTESATA